jgi:hypothetical protein
VNKTYTHQHAVVEGHPYQWTSADLDAARHLTNTISRPWGARGPTPDQRWAARAPITPDERAAFAAAVAEERAVARCELGDEPTRVLNTDEVDEVDRRAIGRALERCGYLTKQEQKRAPRPRRRRRRASLERALRQSREARDDPSQENGVLSDATDTQASPPRPTSPGRAPRVPCQESTSALLALRPAGDTIPAVVDDGSSCSDSRPPPCAAQRERPFSSWWRSPITLILSLAKTAKSSR